MLHVVLVCTLWTPSAFGITPARPPRRFSVARLNSRQRRAAPPQDPAPQRARSSSPGAARRGEAMEQAVPAGAAEAPLGWVAASLASAHADSGPGEGKGQGHAQGPARDAGAGAAAGPAAPAHVMVLSRSRLRRGGRLAAAVRALLYVPPRAAGAAPAVLGQVRRGRAGGLCAPGRRGGRRAPRAPRLLAAAARRAVGGAMRMCPLALSVRAACARE